MIKYKLLQLVFLVSSMACQVVGMVPQEVTTTPSQKKEISEKLGMLLPELKRKIMSSALELKLNPKYEVYKKLEVGSELTGIALNTDNTRVLTGSYDGIARIWDVKEGKVLKQLKGHTAVIRSVALSADEAIAVTGSDDKTARVWNANTGELITILQVGSEVNSVAISANGNTVLIGAVYGSVLLYNVSTGLAQKIGGYSPGALSADGGIAFTGSTNNTALIWDTNTGKLIRILQVGSHASSVALSADGTTAVTATLDKKALVWNVKTGALLNTLLTDLYIMSVALSKDGQRVVTGTNDGKIQVWNTSPLLRMNQTSTPLTELEGHNGPVMALAFGGNDLIASGSTDNTALIWRPSVS